MNRIIMTLLVACAALSCGNEEGSAFRGEDNYITAFALVRGEARYPATVGADSIILSVLDNVSLEGAAPAVVASENATISPDPASVTDWESPATFTVTAFGGQQKTYAYRLARRPLSLEGDVTLTTQADVDAFAASGVSIVNGSLNIAPVASVDAIQSLAGLSKLKSVKYALTIGAAYGGDSMDGLENLEYAGGITVGASYSTKMPLLAGVAFPALQAVKGNLAIYATAAKTVDLPALQSVGGKFAVENDSLYTCNAPGLVTVGDFTFSHPGNTASIVFPKLQAAASMIITYMLKLTSVEFPELREVAGQLYISANVPLVDVVTMPALTSVGSLQISVPGRQGVDFRSLTRVNGTASVSTQGAINYASLTTITGSLIISAVTDCAAFASLESAGSLTISVGENCESLAGLEKLTRVGGDLSVGGPTNGNAKLSDLSGLRSLASVGGRLTLQYLPGVTSLTALQALASTGSAGVTITSLGLASFSPATCPPLLEKIEALTLGRMPLDEVDIRGLGVKNITLSGMEQYETRLIGDGSVLDDLYISICKRLDCTGVEEVKSLRFWGGSSSYATINFVATGIKKAATADMSHYGASLTMPDLEEVTGKLALPYLTNLPKLKRVGELTGSGAAWKGDLSGLTAIDGNCTLSTNYGTNSWERIPLPKLATIGGTLSIKGTSATNLNTKLIDLNGLPALTGVKAVDIQNNGVLVDYSGLQNALSSFTAEDWNVGNNAYNPGYQDMLDGKFIK